ncbi:hypothetical protein HW273_03120 [Oribacterium sp. oral taxon 102]|uniref:hypothetical protein n=1 Tax=Oribacterium sp. oral taxon 102 TaxID=671214 RepID=UPI0015BAE798|nr:hypothetical protein [Oribacterium sp. oral taxon 102]NWO20892.1 hypothetical protein [Oribacterium sp. oral taxon 102]
MWKIDNKKTKIRREKNILQIFTRNYVPNVNGFRKKRNDILCFVCESVYKNRFTLAAVNEKGFRGKRRRKCGREG